MPGITPFRAFSISRLSGGANGCGPLSWHGRLARGRGTPRRWPVLRPNNHPSEATDGFTHAKNAALLRLRPVYWSNIAAHRDSTGEPPVPPFPATPARVDRIPISNYIESFIAHGTSPPPINDFTRNWLLPPGGQTRPAPNDCPLR